MLWFALRLLWSLWLRTPTRQVLAWRQTHLQRFRSVAQNKKFIQFSKGVEIDCDAIAIKIEAEVQVKQERQELAKQVLVF